MTTEVSSSPLVGYRIEISAKLTSIDTGRTRRCISDHGTRYNSPLADHSIHTS